MGELGHQLWRNGESIAKGHPFWDTDKTALGLKRTQFKKSIWGFPGMGVPPKWMVYFHGKIHQQKWMIRGYHHDLGNLHML